MRRRQRSVGPQSFATGAFRARVRVLCFGPLYFFAAPPRLAADSELLSFRRLPEDTRSDLRRRVSAPELARFLRPGVDAVRPGVPGPGPGGSGLWPQTFAPAGRSAGVR